MLKRTAMENSAEVVEKGGCSIEARCVGFNVSSNQPQDH